MAARDQGRLDRWRRHRSSLPTGRRRVEYLFVDLQNVTFNPPVVPVTATVLPGQGDQGFRPVNSRIEANVGDSVMVGPAGAATVVYEDGCKVTVQPGAVATIAPISPCASGAMLKTAGRVTRMTQAVAERTGRPTDSGPSS